MQAHSGPPENQRKLAEGSRGSAKFNRSSTESCGVFTKLQQQVWAYLHNLGCFFFGTRLFWGRCLASVPKAGRSKGQGLKRGVTRGENSCILNRSPGPFLLPWHQNKERMAGLQAIQGQASTVQFRFVSRLREGEECRGGLKFLCCRLAACSGGLPGRKAAGRSERTCCGGGEKKRGGRAQGVVYLWGGAPARTQNPVPCGI